MVCSILAHHLSRSLFLFLSLSFSTAPTHLSLSHSHTHTNMHTPICTIQASSWISKPHDHRNSMVAVPFGSVLGPKILNVAPKTFHRPGYGPSETLQLQNTSTAKISGFRSRLFQFSNPAAASIGHERHAFRCLSFSDWQCHGM